MKPLTHNVQVNTIQLNILKAVVDLLEQRAREPTNNKRTTININSISKIVPHEYKVVKTNLYKFKELIK